MVFRAAEKETISEVAFHTRDNNAGYEVYINKHGKSEPVDSGTPTTPAASGVMPYYGYHTVKLAAPVEVEKGEYFSVMLKLSSSSAYSSVTAAENNVNVSTSTITVAGKSYFAMNETIPAPADWTDGKRIQGGSYNACIKAFSLNAGGGVDGKPGDDLGKDDPAKQEDTGGSSGGGSCMIVSVISLLAALAFLRRRS